MRDKLIPEEKIMAIQEQLSGQKKSFLTGTTLMFCSSGLDEVAIHAGVEKGERHGRAQEDTSAGAVPVRTEPAAGLRRLLCP